MFLIHTLRGPNRGIPLVLFGSFYVAQDFRGFRNLGFNVFRSRQVSRDRECSGKRKIYDTAASHFILWKTQHRFWETIAAIVY